MKNFLQNKMLDEKEFLNLKFACFISIAEVHEVKLKNNNEALFYFNKAANIKNNDFNIWFRMGKLSRL